MSTANSTSGDLPTGLTVDEFLAWAEGRPGRYELHDGAVVMMSPETVGHAHTKFSVQTELQRAIEVAGAACHMLPNGLTVRTENGDAFEPDALVYCGENVDPDAVEITNPIIIVDVLSTNTKRIDVNIKLAGYLSLVSIVHYIVIAPGKRPIVHHQKQSDGTILTSLYSTGTIRLDPPGLELDVERCFA